MMTNVLLYRAQVWGAAELGDVSQHTLSHSLCSSALRRACGYTTVSTPSAHVLCKTVPADLLAGERVRVATELSGVPRSHPCQFSQRTKQLARKETEGGCKKARMSHPAGHELSFQIFNPGYCARLTRPSIAAWL
ncbi:hypothetical protein PGB90_008559 [Kerria lacca]